MTKSLVDNIRQTITPSVVAQLSGTFGESTQSVERGLSGATVAILGIIAARSTDPRFFNQLFSLVKEPVQRGVAGNPCQDARTGSPGSARARWAVWSFPVARPRSEAQLRSPIGWRD